MKKRSSFLMASRLALLFGLAGAIVGAASACSTPAVDGRVNAATIDGASFAPVSGMLLAKCGTLDCHGSRYRNFRLLGNGASRLEATATPRDPTTAAEHAANYQSFVALEPEKMADVAASKGAKMGDLTVVRKGRGDEEHKGGKRIVAGDDADKCLVSWFNGTLAPASDAGPKTSCELAALNE